MINRGSVVGAMKAVALAVAILVGLKLVSIAALELGLYTIEKGWAL